MVGDGWDWAELYFEPEGVNVSVLKLAQKVRFNFTPVNASWLNMAEIEIHAFSTHCFNRRLESQKIVTEQIKHIINEHSGKRIFVNRQFSIDKTRDKFS